MTGLRFLNIKILFFCVLNGKDNKFLEGESPRHCLSTMGDQKTTTKFEAAPRAPFPLGKDSLQSLLSITFQLPPNFTLWSPTHPHQVRQRK